MPEGVSVLIPLVWIGKSVDRFGWLVWFGVMGDKRRWMV